MYWLEAFGWLGSAVVVISLMLGSSKQFRWWNFTGCALATAYNGIIGVWPFFAMNFIIALIDAYWLVRIYREERQLAETKAQTVEQALATEGADATICQCPNCGHLIKA
ncbi:hypothetical protein [Boudabousia marimammalium]|uniref:Uncharacterized protein n=1 Tax=Boudabousia marimammalium TaxID=156892 RepID=A0A1Q5PST1_9ACTO|nr:hypothetical protein [Boudabousia marimammalium]OKL50505.1 hypothetical protein BM477_00585 [Boudabousia marimammalium]